MSSGRNAGEELGKVEDIQHHDLAYSAARQLVFNQLIIFVNNHQGALKTKKASLRLEEEEFNQKLRYRRIMRQELEFILSSALSLVLVFFIGLGVGAIAGTFAGINATEGAVCAHSNVQCKLFRRNPKSVY